MKQLTCEMCGSADLVKQDGLFVCQNCGCKYSVEEAKKMMVEGTVEVTGTVAIDQGPELEKYLQLATNAERIKNWDSVDEYAEKALLVSPEEPLAWFYKAEAAVDKVSKDDPTESLKTQVNAVNAIRNAIDYYEKKLSSQKPFTTREAVTLLQLRKLPKDLTYSSWEKCLEVYVQMDYAHRQPSIDALKADVNQGKALIKQACMLIDKHHEKINEAYKEEFKNNPEVYEQIDEGFKKVLNGEEKCDYLNVIATMYGDCIQLICSKLGNGAPRSSFYRFKCQRL